MSRQKVEALAAIYGAVDVLVRDLDEADFESATGCAEFSVRDLLFHLMLDAQRALMAFADPLDAPPDTDAVTYWQKYVAGLEPDSARHVRFVRRSALAYENPKGLVRHWADTSRAAVSAARRTDPDATVDTQGHRLKVEDFIDTLVVEATVHYLDLSQELLANPIVPADAFAVTRATLERLVSVPLPSTWDDEAVVLKTTGRSPLTDEDRGVLGDGAAHIPVIR